MQNETAREAIERLEDEIERLAVRRERCRKVSLAAKTAIAAGARLARADADGARPSEPSLFFASLAAIIGGIVLLVSTPPPGSRPTRLWPRRTRARALIGAIELRVVDGGVRQVQ